ncbi:MAG: TetR/AcrR family transcriptional regulator [Chloroflexi bacterium]|nr:TetR/AcrR family transcriptional regulator [Chloroflexota bacterium]
MSHANGRGTRDRIIHAAGDVIARVGYQSATIEEIVRVVGISTPPSYGHFARKEDVLLAIVEVVSDRIRAIGQDLRGVSVRDRSNIAVLLERMTATQASFFYLFPALLFAVAGRPDFAERVFDEVILPTWDALGIATRPPGAIESIEATRARAMALIGMATYYSLARQVFARRPEFLSNDRAIEQFARIFHEGVSRGGDSG